jgi:hypothetical protein
VITPITTSIIENENRSLLSNLKYGYPILHRPYSENYLQYKKGLSAFWSSRDEAFTLKVDAYFETLFTRKHRTVKGDISF